MCSKCMIESHKAALLRMLNDVDPYGRHRDETRRALVRSIALTVDLFDKLAGSGAANFTTGVGKCVSGPVGNSEGQTK